MTGRVNEGKKGIFPASIDHICIGWPVPGEEGGSIYCW